MLKKFSNLIGSNEDSQFLSGLQWIERLVAKLLSVGMVIIILVAVVDHSTKP